MRGLRPAHDVVNPDCLESALVEFGQPGFQQPAHGLAALRAELPLLGGNAAAERRAPRAAARAVTGPGCCGLAHVPLPYCRAILRRDVRRGSHRIPRCHGRRLRVRRIRVLHVSLRYARIRSVRIRYARPRYLRTSRRRAGRAGQLAAQGRDNSLRAGHRAAFMFPAHPGETSGIRNAGTGLFRPSLVSPAGLRLSSRSRASTFRPGITILASPGRGPCAQVLRAAKGSGLAVARQARLPATGRGPGSGSRWRAAAPGPACRGARRSRRTSDRRRAGTRHPWCASCPSAAVRRPR